MKYNNCKCCFLRVEDLGDCDVNCQLASFFVGRKNQQLQRKFLPRGTFDVGDGWAAG
jgi:hypothetical protein